MRVFFFLIVVDVVVDCVCLILARPGKTQTKIMMMMAGRLSPLGLCIFVTITRHQG